MEEGSVILPVASMVTDFLKLCQLGDLKGINALVYPVEPVSPRSDDEDADPEPDAEKEPAIDVNIVNEKNMSEHDDCDLLFRGGNTYDSSILSSSSSKV